MKAKTYIQIAIIVFVLAGFSQNMMAQTNTFPSTGAAGIGTTAPNASSLLEIKSTSKGFLAPRMTKAQRDAISSPATGLLIYQTNSTPGFYYYSGSAWKAVTPNASGWSLTGNAGTTNTNFLGTTDNNNFRIRTNNIERVVIDTSGNLVLQNGVLTIKNTASSANVVINRANTIAGTSNQISFQDNSATKWAIGGTNIGSAGANNFSLYNYTISDNALTVLSNSNNVGIGTNSPLSKLHVEDGTNGVAIQGNCTNNSFGGTTIGVYGKASTGYGVYGVSNGVSNDDVSAGVYGSGYYGIYGSSSNWAGYFNGYVYCTASYQGSDSRLKQNIVDFSSAISIINQLRPKQYEYKQDGPYSSMGLPQGKHYGLIAQDVEQVLPNVVKETSFNTRLAQPLAKEKQPASQSSEVVKFKAVNYTELIPILVKAVQELNEKNDDLQKQVDELKAMSVSNKSVTNGQQLAIISAALLQQNIPNPFATNTTITYTLPQKFANAQIVIIDKSGKAIKSVNISGSGNGSLQVDASTLAAGAYSYSLLVDGKLISTRQMILAK